MKRENKCPKCGSSKVITHAEVLVQDYSAGIMVAKCRKPEAILFKGRQGSLVSAWVCTTCGFMEFYADAPRKLKVAAA